ncbi:A-kinase anchor protein 10, mitochondrial [Desmophyllum pertusum]|uniref:A-kinase anchor protein 10, mitochondrial n=1 Tax=Desmophyllum pertusum TaxID=174260 RepID=A0A9W9ZUR3_9CNID|nr:A-kinase anchor protein 10, mitochondrial [Desmophyllum pertusum]
MRKLVSGGEDKAKEEMAWKIAKMIIKDVKNEQAMSFDPGNTASLWTMDDSMALT